MQLPLYPSAGPFPELSTHSVVSCGNQTSGVWEVSSPAIDLQMRTSYSSKFLRTRQNGLKKNHSYTEHSPARSPSLE
eukprot:1741553-Amphidinium_carterae.1